MSASTERASAESSRVRGLRRQLRGEAKRLGTKQGRALIADAIVQCPDWLANANTLTVVTFAPGIRQLRAWRLLHRAGINDGRPLSHLTDRQRARLAELLTEVL